MLQDARMRVCRRSLWADAPDTKRNEHGGRMRFITQTVSSAAVLCVVFAAATTATMAQTWPTKITRVVVPLSPGSGADVAGRLITDQVGRQVGKSFVVENRPGAGNTIGM